VGLSVFPGLSVRDIDDIADSTQVWFRGSGEEEKKKKALNYGMNMWYVLEKLKSCKLLTT